MERTKVETKCFFTALQLKKGRKKEENVKKRVIQTRLNSLDQHPKTNIIQKGSHNKSSTKPHKRINKNQFQPSVNVY